MYKPARRVSYCAGGGDRDEIGAGVEDFVRAARMTERSSCRMQTSRQRWESSIVAAKLWVDVVTSALQPLMSAVAASAVG